MLTVDRSICRDPANFLTASIEWWLPTSARDSLLEQGGWLCVPLYSADDFTLIGFTQLNVLEIDDAHRDT